MKKKCARDISTRRHLEYHMSVALSLDQLDVSVAGNIRRM
jgi:hypothetical protein